METPKSTGPRKRSESAVSPGTARKKKMTRRSVDSVSPNAAAGTPFVARFFIRTTATAAASSAAMSS